MAAQDEAEGHHHEAKYWECAEEARTDRELGLSEGLIRAEKCESENTGLEPSTPSTPSPGKTNAPPGGKAPSTTTTTPTTTADASGPTEDNRLALTSPDPTSKSVGVVKILSEGGKHAFYLAAEHLPPSDGFSYVVWLYNSPNSHEALSKSPPVGSDGRVEGGALLPANAFEYHTMLLTRETSERPSHPGPVVLSGSFSLGH
jgi:hypothetical protein